MRIEPTGKRVRGVLGGRMVVDSVRTMLVWEKPQYPTYWFPEDDVAPGVLAATEGLWRRGEPGDDGLKGLVRFDWRAMDAWFEEDEEVIVHARSPYTRVDILASSRHVEVALNGVTVADSVRPRLLFETGLPTRYYLPLTDVRIDLLVPSERTSQCPYKGTASYWSVELDGEVFPDIVWTYRAPLAESIKIAGLACFYNERVDLTVDGVREERPGRRR